MMEMTDVLLSFAGGIAVAVLLYKGIHIGRKHIVLLRQRRRHERIVFEALNLALVQTSACRIELTDGESTGASVEGVCTEVSKDYISIDCSSSATVLHWRHRRCHVSFEVRKDKKKAYYHFPSVIFETDKLGSRVALYIDMPDALELGQKRSFLRCRPVKDKTVLMGLWVIPTGQALPLRRDDVKAALFMYKRNESNYIKLNNISAGGVLVTIEEKAMEGNSLCLKNGTQVLFLLVLESGEESKKPLALWLSCRVTSLRHVEREKAWMLGMRFENWATVESESKPIVWFPTDKDKSIPQLAAWVMRTHLGQNKF